MSKHAKPETPIERADRLIRELKDTPRVTGAACQTTPAGKP